MSTVIAENRKPHSARESSLGLHPLDRVVAVLQRFGFVVGAMHMLSVPDRRSGILRSTPVTILTVEGQRYLAAAREDAEWVVNARAAGRGVLARGRTDEHVALSELTAAEGGPILAEIPRQHPRGVSEFAWLYGVAADPEAFAALAPRCPVFRVTRA